MTTPCFLPWSRDEDARLRQLAASGCTKQDVAQALGRTVNAVGARAAATRVRFQRQRNVVYIRPKKQMRRRRCLRCRNLFDTESRFQFVCDLCHDAEEWRCADLG